jgi:SAM-dependent methyltransferase
MCARAAQHALDPTALSDQFSTLQRDQRLPGLLVLYSSGGGSASPLGRLHQPRCDINGCFMRMTHIDIPEQFHRNSASVLALGVEATGLSILEHGNQLLGWPDLSNKDVLDVGCGVRFAQTIINRNLPIQSYTGIDIDRPLIDYLTDNVHDSRFSFQYWDVYNELYNRSGHRLTKHLHLPLNHTQKFDLIWMYSVITHTYPADTECLLTILRRSIKADGRLLFSALLDPTIASFDDRVKDQPLAMAYYNDLFLRQLIVKTGWHLEVLSDKRPDSVMQSLFICRPTSARWHVTTSLHRRIRELWTLFKSEKPR